MAQTFCAAAPVGFESKNDNTDGGDDGDAVCEQKENADIADSDGTEQNNKVHKSGGEGSDAMNRKYLVEGGMRLCTSCFWIYHRYPRQLIQSEGMANKILDLAKSKQVWRLNA